ncbi:MAG TPA: helix-turn-helix transcriptional regulator [Gemmataceae bacterium]|nr:helix-turn-helix transcriptional regulator [Gemmataceae bacterium]
MTIRSETRKIERSPAEKARLKAIRAAYQKTKPTLQELAAQGAEVVPLGTYLAVQQLLTDLRRTRRERKLTLEQVAEKAGMDKATLSRLETGKQPNPTVDSLFRVASALGKTISMRLEGTGLDGRSKRARKAPA